jgi:L-lysine 2,3-aminomutase
MAHIVTLNTPSREDWLTQLADVVTDPDELLRLLNIDADEKLLAGRSAKKLFALRVPRSFIEHMQVIRHHAGIEQRITQVCQRLCVIVHIT